MASQGNVCSVNALDQSKQDTQIRKPICKYIGQVTTKPKFSQIPRKGF
jgi:hypothetical protein